MKRVIIALAIILGAAGTSGCQYVRIGTACHIQTGQQLECSK